MTIITTKQLRSRMAEFVDLLLNGQEVELHYRSKKVTLIGKKPTQRTKNNLKEAVARLEKYKINDKYKKAKDFKEIMNKYYELD